MRAIRLFFVALTIMGIAWPTSAQNPENWNSLPSMPQLLPYSARVPLANICNALSELLPISVVDVTMPEGCSYTRGPFFVLARSDNVTLNIRFKLNSAVGQELRDLSALRNLIADFHNHFSWPQPADFLSTLAEGKTASCRAGILQYRFSREGGAVPRYNAVLRTNAASDVSFNRFVHAAPVCF